MSSDAPPDAGRADVVRGVSWVGLSHVIGQLAWYASLFIIAALVAPKAFGSVAFAMVLVQVAWLVVGSGTRGSFVVAPRITSEQVRHATAVNVGAGLLLGCAVALAAGPLVDLLAPGSDVAVLQVLAFSIALFGLSIVPMALLQKELMFKRHAAVMAFAAAFSSVVAVIAAELGMGVWALVMRQVLFQFLLASLAWVAARSILPARPRAQAGPQESRRPPQAKWFFALAVITFIALNVDYIIVGRFTSIAQLGLYSLAFTIAFAPMTQFAWQIGKVLFPAAARTKEPGSVSGRTLKAVRLTALVLLPLVPVALVLAPLVLPRLLGSQWSPIVGPFQLLLAIGVVHAILAVLREFLLGTGHVGLCARIDAVWLVGTTAALLVLVPAFGIAGAALAHLAMLPPLAAAYVYFGLPRLGLDGRALVRSLSGVLAAVGAEVVVIALAAIALAPLRLPALPVAALVPAIGVATAVVVLWRLRSGALADARAMVSALRGRPATSA
jgi:O-antigen/teichoic acid export membrane protein